MSRCTIVPDQTSMDWTEPHSTRLTPKSSLLRRLPPHFLGERRSIGSRLHSLKHPGLQGEEVGSMGEAFLTEVTISYRYTLLGPWTLHLLTAATLVLSGGLWPWLTRPTSLSVWAQWFLCLSSNLTIPKPAKVCIPRNVSQLMAPTFTHIHSHTYPNSKSCLLYPLKHPTANSSTPLTPPSQPGHHRLSRDFHSSLPLLSLLPFLPLPIYFPHGSNMTFKNTYEIRSLLCLKPISGFSLHLEQSPSFEHWQENGQPEFACLFSLTFSIHASVPLTLCLRCWPSC